MKRLTTLLASVTLLGLCLPALAQDDRALQAEERIQALIERLQLTEEQIDEVRPVLEESAAAQQRILSTYGLDPESRQSAAERPGRRQLMTMRKEMNAVREKTMAKLEQSLSDEQLAEFERIQEERRAEMRERMRSGR